MLTRTAMGTPGGECNSWKNLTGFQDEQDVDFGYIQKIAGYSSSEVIGIRLHIP